MLPGIYGRLHSWSRCYKRELQACATVGVGVELVGLKQNESWLALALAHPERYKNWIHNWMKSADEEC